MALQCPFTVERFRHDNGLEVRVVGALDADDGIRQAGFDQCGNLRWIHKCLFTGSYHEARFVRATITQFNKTGKQPNTRY